MGNKNSDIEIIVNENGNYKKYGLSFELFNLIKPVLDESSNKSDVVLTDIAKGAVPESLGSGMLMGMLSNMNRKTILYDLNEKPEEYTFEQVKEEYSRSGFVVVKSKSDNLNTKTLF